MTRGGFVTYDNLWSLPCFCLVWSTDVSYTGIRPPFLFMISFINTKILFPWNCLRSPTTRLLYLLWYGLTVLPPLSSLKTDGPSVFSRWPKVWELSPNRLTLRVRFRFGEEQKYLFRNNVVSVRASTCIIDTNENSTLPTQLMTSTHHPSYY